MKKHNTYLYLEIFEALFKDSDVQMSQTQSQGQKAAASMSSEDQKRKVDELVKFLLIMDQKKLPIKKLDINKHVMKEHSKALPVIIQKAARKLKQVFGIELVELEGDLKGNYILVNMLDIDEDNNHLQWPDEDNSKMGLLMIVLSLIFMNGNIMEESKLWSTLKKLGLDVDMPHEEFGDVRKLITTEFVRQRYLEVTKQLTAEVPVLEFSWGQRAKVETSKMKVLQFVSQVYNVACDEWRSQYQDATSEENQGPQPGTSSSQR